MLREELEKHLTKAIKKAGLSLPTSFAVSRPAEESFGDFASNVALIIAQDQKKNPHQIAQRIVSSFSQDKLIDRLEVAGPGFINFWLSESYLKEKLTEILKNKEAFGQGQEKKNQKYLVEYATPNTHKSFHIGHLRNIVTGEALSRLLAKTAAQVIRVNYQGDVGLHIAKAMWSLRQKKMPKAADISQRMTFVTDSYVEGSKAWEAGEKKSQIEKINQQLYEASDPKLEEIYQLTRQWSLDYLESIYQRLGVKFDRYYFESQIAKRGKELALQALKSGIFIKSQGAIIYPGSKYGLHDRVFITQKGHPTYEAKDLGLAELQFRENVPDLIFHVVAPEQSGYFKVVFAAMAEVLPETKGKEQHLEYGWVRLKNGKMSSRLGEVVLGEWLLDEAKKRIQAKYQVEDRIAEDLAQGAIKYSFLKVKITQDIAFDIESSISLEGDSGPYLQYTVARIYGLFRKAGIEPVELAKEILKFTAQEKFTEKELIILRQLVFFPEIIAQSVAAESLHYLCDYLQNLADKVNSYYGAERILGDDKAGEFQRLTLVLAAAFVLQNGLSILSIKTPTQL